MGFLDELKDFWATLRRLASHWRLLAALVLLLGFGGLYLQKKFFSAAPPPQATTQTGQPTGGETSPPPAPGEKAPQEKAPEEKPPQAGVEPPAESLAGQTIEVAARPVLLFRGESKWDEAAKALSAAIAKVAAAAAKAGLTPNGRPLVVFTQTDDNGFHFEAMTPLAKAPEGKIKLPEGVEAGSSPAGKALKFEHRGSYDEIEATYEAITAYLDEKGLDTENLFIEEYLTDLSSAEDANVDVDIYVFLK